MPKLIYAFQSEKIMICLLMIWRSFLVTLIVVVSFLEAQGQINLVPNFSFEMHDTCPNNVDQISFVTGWSKYSSNSVPDNTTPDYYNACSPDTLFGVPKSANGFQYARRNCNAYVGLATFSSGYPNFREHIGIQLTSPMVVGQKYFLSFYSVMGGDILQGGYYFCMPSDKIGMRLSTVSFNENSPTPIDNFAHLYLQTVQSDTLNWMRISGSIVADSAYQYLVLGNFFDDANTDTTHWNCPQCQNIFGYSLIDDICISTDSSFCNGGIDGLPCATSIFEAIKDDGIRVFPNPTNDIITISFEDTYSYEINLYDAIGKLLYTENISSKNSVSIGLQPFPLGVYFVTLNNQKNNQTINRKIIKL